MQQGKRIRGEVFEVVERGNVRGSHGVLIRRVARVLRIARDRRNIAFARHRFRQSNLCFTENGEESVAV